MPTRNVVLTEHQQELVEALVSSGCYQNASEVLQDGLRLVEQREARDAEKTKAMRRAADEGWADIAAGRYTDVTYGDLDDYTAGLGKHGTAAAACG